jgi:hypothetical protein
MGVGQYPDVANHSIVCDENQSRQNRNARYLSPASTGSSMESLLVDQRLKVNMVSYDILGSL